MILLLIYLGLEISDDSNSVLPNVDTICIANQPEILSRDGDGSGQPGGVEMQQRWLPHPPPTTIWVARRLGHLLQVYFQFLI